MYITMKAFFRSLFSWLWTKKWRVLAVLLVLIGGAFWFGKKYF